MLDDVDAAVINTNYATQAGLDPVKDPIARENPKGPYVNIIAVRGEDKDKPWVKALVEVLPHARGEEVRRREVQGRGADQLVERARILNRTSLNWPGALPGLFYGRRIEMRCQHQVRDWLWGIE